ncbi:MAG: 3-keto-disaccharide hydrolase [Thermoguttaceae bacterium]
MFRKIVASVVFGCVLCAGVSAAESKPDADGFVTIFDGKTLEGWKANEPTTNFKVENGEIVGFGDRCHLYYMEPLKDFEMLMDVCINKGGNSGVYVKSPWVDSNWPTGGFELQVNSSQSDPVKTGSLYDLIKFFKAPHGDDEWFTYHVICKDETITVKVNDQVLYTYVDPAGKKPATNADGKPIKHIGQVGHIALQQHDPGSTPRFKNIKIKKL